MKKIVVKNKKQILIIVVIALIITSITAFNVYKKMGTYSGLGSAKEYPTNQYDMSKLYQDENNFRRYKAFGKKGIPGIDVSAYQGDINWEEVKESGAEFVMIRLGLRSYEDALLYLDSKFEENLTGAKEAGLAVGVYFYSQAVTPEEAIEEARFVIRHIRGRGVNLPVAFDMEPAHETDRISVLSVEEKTQIADAFCKVIKRNGYKPVIYGNPHWLTNSIDLSYLTDYDLWLANYEESTEFPYDFKMWQYTESGVVPGISGYVDLDIYFK